MLGAIIGDIVGSRFEFNNHRSKDFDLFVEGCLATDDSIMTLAVAKALLECHGDWRSLSEKTVEYMQSIGRKYPNCGYGGAFHQWIFSDHPEPYNSFGNGAAMRVSPCGFIAETEDEAKLLSRKVTEISHNHKEGIKGAEAATVAIFMARSGALKQEIHDRIARDYFKLDFTLDSIRDTYEFNETCQDTVPQAIVAFLEATSFEDAIRNTISIGGDSDTLAAITGAIAEAYYGVPGWMKRKAISYLDDELRGIFREWEKETKSGKPARQFELITKYVDKLKDKTNWHSFFDEFYIFVNTNPEYELNEYQTILEKNSLKWTEESMQSADENTLGAQAILALILGVFRAERFTDGVLERFISDGYIAKWLGRLKIIDNEREPQSFKPLLTQVKMTLHSFQQGSTSELIVTEKQVIIKTTRSEGGSVAHQYDLDAISGFGEVSLSIMSDCLAAEGWNDILSFEEISSALNLYELGAEYEDSKTVSHKGIFDRAHMPEKTFTLFVDLLRVVIQSYGFGSIVGLSGFMGALKKGEVKYCGVEFSDGGKIYHYRTTDLRIEVGDEVIVPVGENNYEREATIKTVEFCRWDDTPYPLEKTKEIIRMVDDDVASPPPPQRLLDVTVDTPVEEEEDAQFE